MQVIPIIDISTPLSVCTAVTAVNEQGYEFVKRCLDELENRGMYIFCKCRTFHGNFRYMYYLGEECILNKNGVL
jgi:hypothetical protein